MIPIRFWNRIDNIGDLINPYVVEAVSGRCPVFVGDDSVEHLLGVGSIFFMATKASHIWGSGILDPNSNLDHVDIKKIHAIRGSLTRDIFRSQYGLTRDLPMGDPGIFADEIPEVVAFRQSTTIKRRIAFIPHYSAVQSIQMRQFSRALDAEIVSPRTGRLEFLREIIASEIVVSQSLHGLIFAELFGKPSVWLSYSNDKIWTFKFYDWFSNLHEPPKAPLLFGAPPADIVGSARLSGLRLDRKALREALPVLPDASRKPGIPFRESRQRAPFVVRVATGGGTVPEWEYDETIYCSLGDDRSLQRQLNALGQRLDEPCSVWLVFDPASYANMTVDWLRTCRDLLTRYPTTHFIGCPPTALRRPEGKRSDQQPEDSALELYRWEATYAWQGVVLVRYPPNFGFSAPGLAAFSVL